MTIQRHQIDMTTDSGGAFTGLTAAPINGRLLEVQYIKGNFDNGSSMTVTAQGSGRSVLVAVNLDASAVRSPRQVVHDITGAAALYAAGGTPVTDHIYLANEKLKVVVTSGGNAKTGTLQFIVES